MKYLPYIFILVLALIIFGGVLYFKDAKIGAVDEISVAKLTEKYNLATEIKSKYVLDNVSLVKTDIKNAELDAYNGEPKDEIKITLGEKDATEFTPDIELKRWNEVSFKIKPRLSDVLLKDKTLSFVGDKIKFDTPKISFEMYDYTEGEGGFKYIWYLNEKPLTNKVEFQIESSGLDFFYQPPLTEEYQNGYSERFKKEIVVTETQVKDLEGNVLVERPENVVGSYVFYHQTRGGMVDTNGKDYKTGQGGIIYPSHITDVEGKTSKAILKIENGIFSEEIPQDFLDTAVYPIKGNANFGYETAGGSSAYIQNTSLVSVETGVAGTATSITTYHRAYSASYLGGYTYALMTYNSGADTITTKIAQTGVGTTVTTADWRTANLTTTPTISAIGYGLGMGFEKYTYYYYNSGGNSVTTGVLTYYTTWPDLSVATASTNRLSIYATYTPAGGGAPADTTQINISDE